VADAFVLFVGLSAVNVVTPGPGVMLTLTNAVRHSWGDAFAGILGVATGTFLVASLSVIGVGAVLLASSVAFAVMKYAGATYLIYLGIKMWRAPAGVFAELPTTRASLTRRFAEGFVLQASNPNAILFFLALFPQFIDHGSHGLEQSAVLVATYAAIVVVIHSLYALGARRTRAWLSSAGGGRLVNRVSGTAFILSGLALAAASPRLPR
jgi:threonine/homoserine/homoserine lactone efflux protein